MFSVHRKKVWAPNRETQTDPSIYLERRAVLRAMGLGAGSLALAACSRDAIEYPEQVLAPMSAPANPRFLDPGRPLSDEALVTSYTNFYEFGVEKELVRARVGDFKVDPWQVRIDGLVGKPGNYSVAELEELVAPEERQYRHRCVEAWAMTVPWIGIPFASLIEQLDVHEDARYVRFTTAHRPDEMPGVPAQPHYPWPYFDCLEIEEAKCELTMLATGLYGKRLAKQNGAPVRLVVPWKYGLKSIKSLARIEFTKIRRGSFWNSIGPEIYSWHSNVEPQLPHPDWSQETERLLGENRRVKTKRFNGYGDYVAKLYA